MSELLRLVLLAIIAFVAYRELANAWFLHQCRKRRRAEQRGLRLVVSNRRSN